MGASERAAPLATLRSREGFIAVRRHEGGYGAVVAKDALNTAGTTLVDYYHGESMRDCPDWPLPGQAMAYSTSTGKQPFS